MSRGRPGRPVRCVETGRVFDSVTAAANFLSLIPQSIFCVLGGKAKTAGGYHWEYVEEEPTPKKQDKPRSAPAMTIYEVQEEARRRTEETGRYTRYADIQKEETLRLARNQTTVHKPKKKRGAKK